MSGITVIRPFRAATAIAVAALVSGPSLARSQTDTLPRLPTGGVMQPSPALAARWCWSGAWRYPVGDARNFQEPGETGGSAYRVSRNVGVPDFGARPHQGADLSCGHGGDLVRAAATGLVVVAARQGWNSGYGRHVVIGHRLPDGTLTYSVYAHLAPGTVKVRAGQTVPAGALLGRVGSTGRATSPHLHFEVRVADDCSTPWEDARVVDPLAFVGARLPTAAADSLSGCWGWAAYAGLVDSLCVPDCELLHGAWWQMLAVAAAHQWSEIPTTPTALRDSLVASSILPEADRDHPASPVTWAEFSRDLKRLHALKAKLPARPVSSARLRALCRDALDTPSPVHDSRGLAKREGQPHTWDAVLAMADLAPVAAAPKHRASKPPS